MKRLTLVLGSVLAGLATGCLEKSGGKPGAQFGALLRLHFAGSTPLARDTNSAKLRQIWALPATAELRQQTFQKLAKAPHQFWLKNLPAGVSDQAPLIRPLLDDLIANEWFLEVRGPVERSESVLAIQLTDERAKAWRTNLWQLCQGWKLGAPREVTLEGAKGWEVRGAVALNLVQFVHTGRWVLIGLGQNRLTLLPTLAQQTSKGGRPVPALANAWLDVQADLPALRRWCPVFDEYKLPPTHLTITGKGQDLRTEAKLIFSEKIPWSFEPWKLPTGIIRERTNNPIVSFTVGQGIAPLLSQVKGFADLGLKPLPNQFCVWAYSGVLGQSYLTTPVPDATNAMRRLAATLPKWTLSHFEQSLGQIGYATNRAHLFWSGLPPIVLPALHPLREDGTDYLLCALSPMRRLTNPAPPGLFAQIQGRKNLAYYDWEITQERLVHARQLFQIQDMLDGRILASTNWPGHKWLLQIAPLLGNTVTEITVHSPTELSLVRRSPIGLTGFELVLLTRWLDSPGFPLKFEKPPRRPDPREVLQARTNATKRATNTLQRPKP
jgi:hypothetical protein